ncbi:MAG: hypothetical protein ACOCVG_03070, partial [Verrucomicrobiota bacterium]
RHTGEELRSGDIERALLEWRSILSHIVNRPDYPWSRWQTFQQTVRHYLDQRGRPRGALDAPPLSPAQRTRRPCIVRF